jgi:hypothetical protein
LESGTAVAFARLLVEQFSQCGSTRFHFGDKPKQYHAFRNRYDVTPIEQQGAGGLKASYSGTIKTDRAPNAISFLAGSMVDANVTGDWRPLADAADGTNPADYGARVRYLGGFAVVNFAGRNLVAELVGPGTTINGSGQFDLGTTSVEFLSGDLAYRGPAGIGSGTSTLANQTGPLSGTGSLGSATQSGQTSHCDLTGP